MSAVRVAAPESRDALISTIQTTQRIARDAQWRAWLATSEARGQGAPAQAITDLTRSGTATRHRSATGWRLLRGIAFGAAALIALLN